MNIKNNEEKKRNDIKLVGSKQQLQHNIIKSK